MMQISKKLTIYTLNWNKGIHNKKAGDSHPLFSNQYDRFQVGSSSLNVRVPEIIVETIVCRDMISSRTAA